MNKGLVEIRLNGATIGHLALTHEGLCAFEYDPRFLREGFSISPYALPLKKKVFVAERDPFEGNFGVFDDSLPDGWGNLLLDRYLKTQGKNPSNLTIPERLCLIGSCGRGALEYYPDNSLLHTEAFQNFDRIANACRKILQEQEVSNTQIETLYKNGGSSGGARPKIFAKIDGREWLIKFRATFDPENIGVKEYQHALLAKECGIEMSETRLINGKYFAVERFDRIDGIKIHTISASGLLHAYYRLPSLDYSDLLTVCADLTKDHKQVIQMFRRMVFNVLIGNKDDHSKNFSFQYQKGAWKLAPAYDLVPCSGFNDAHTTSVNGRGNPSTADMLVLAEHFDISPKTAKTIIAKIEEKCGV